MVEFDKIYFGCADASTEADRNPGVFKKVFFDPSNHLNELLNGECYILRGRKGDGKTTYSEQIKLNADSEEIHVVQRTLNNFNNSTFIKIKTFDDFGGNPYISFWKCVLLIEYVGMLNRCEPNLQKQSFVDIFDALNRQGLISSDSDISLTVTKLVETGTTINIKSFFERKSRESQVRELKGAEQIYEAILESIKEIYLGSKKFVFIIDGLDDILNHSEFKAEIICGLIRAVDEINRKFKKTLLSIKTIILIRDDILNLCRDPNLSKIIRDSSIRLSWEIYDNPFESNLIEMVGKRMDAVTGNNNSFREVWEEVFPLYMGTRESISYVLDNIIYRPRDILQFFIEVQKEFIPGRTLTQEKIETALKKYSTDYFVDAMRDELTGFFPNETVTALPDVLSKMGTRYFYLEDFENECKSYHQFDGVSPKQLLDRLFDAGYIGQHRLRENDGYTVFSYRNIREKFQEQDECILHRGLMRALTL